MAKWVIDPETENSTCQIGDWTLTVIPKKTHQNIYCVITAVNHNNSFHFELNYDRDLIWTLPTTVCSHISISYLKYTELLSFFIVKGGYYLNNLWKKYTTGDSTYWSLSGSEFLIFENDMFSWCVRERRVEIPMEVVKAMLFKSEFFR